MLSELLGVKGVRNAPKDNSVVSTQNPQMTNSGTQESLYLRLKPNLIFGGVVVYAFHRGAFPSSMIQSKPGTQEDAVNRP
jgi:hypothetical protein